MEVFSVVIDNDCDLYDAGDFHLGSALCHEKGINAMVQNIKSDRHNRLINKGDNIEAILVTDKRFSLGGAKTVIISEQIDAVCDTLSPIQNQIASMAVGNHEITLWNYSNVTKEVLRRLDPKGKNIKYAGYAWVCHFLDKKGNLIFKYYGTHGRRSINNSNPDKMKRLAFKLGVLKAQLQEKASDCLVMSKGHAHKLLVRNPLKELYMNSDGSDLRGHYTCPNMGTPNYIHEDSRWYICSGSFLKTNIIGAIGYAESAEMDPVELGCAVIEVREGKVWNVRKVTA